MNPVNYRPITVPSNLLRILTVRICKIMTSIVEDQKLLGEEQYGFRRERSTLDAVFILSTMMQKCKIKRWQYSAAFIDISKVQINNFPLKFHDLIICTGLRLSVSSPLVFKTVRHGIWRKDSFYYQIHVFQWFTYILFKWEIFTSSVAHMWCKAR